MMMRALRSQIAVPLGAIALALLVGAVVLIFTSPLVTGPFCRLYEREDMTMVAKSTVKPENLGILVFHVGGPTVASLRRVLGEIATKTSIQVDADRWTSHPT